MNVIHVCTTADQGGAAKAARRLHNGLVAMGVRSRIMEALGSSDDEDVLHYNPLAPAPAALGRTFFRIARRWQRFSFRNTKRHFTPEWSIAGWRLASQLPTCDAVNLHWVADFLDYRALPAMAAKTTFTGGCHYTGSCERFTERCSCCPQLSVSYHNADITRRILDRKRRIFARIPRSRLTLVCPSRWIAGEAGRSSVCQNFDIRIIPNGLDTRQFAPMEQAEARRRLGLPSDARIILFVSDLVDDRRKGLALLLEAFDFLRNIPRLMLVTMGRGDTSLLTGPFFRHLGTVHDADRLRAAYSAADIFAVPSLQDNLPNTILESMACGTPVVGFSVGGIREVIVDGQTGLLAPAGDSNALAVSLRCLLENSQKRQAFSGESRLRIEREYSVELQAERYFALYSELAGPTSGVNPHKARLAANLEERRTGHVSS